MRKLVFFLQRVPYNLLIGADFISKFLSNINKMIELVFKYRVQQRSENSAEKVEKRIIYTDPELKIAAYRRGGQLFIVYGCDYIRGNTPDHPVFDFTIPTELPETVVFF